MIELRREMSTLLYLCLIWLCFCTSVFAGDVTLSDEVQQCLGCHGKRGITFNMESNESLSAYVDAEQFRVSAHGFLSCSTCHSEFSSEKHPERTFRSKEQYRVKSSRACRKCHTDGQLKAKPIHVNLLKDESAGKPHACSNCHSAHAVTLTAGAKKFSSEEQYCLGCHSHAMTLTFRNGETMSLTIDKASLEASLHSKLSCSDCHYGFSTEEHPRRNFRSRREYTVASSESCRRCHFDKYTRTLDSIHFSALSRGNLKAPSCTDCHGSHSMTPVEKERTVSARRCRNCHEETYDTYANSVHGKALLNEQNRDVPVCKDCHTAHSVRDPHALEYHEKIPEMCGNCHSNKDMMAKYGLSTNVVKTYLSDFHGITLGFYKKQRETLYKPARPIAVCTDCHGTHTIMSTRGVSAAAVKANLAQRCRQCHVEAPRNFPDAWLSHYEPSLTKTPLVFTINLAYKIFIPILLTGLFLQILLHIWRYAVNR